MEAYIKKIDWCLFKIKLHLLCTVWQSFIFTAKISISPVFHSQQRVRKIILENPEAGHLLVSGIQRHNVIAPILNLESNPKEEGQVRLEGLEWDPVPSLDTRLKLAPSFLSRNAEARAFLRPASQHEQYFQWNAGEWKMREKGWKRGKLLQWLCLLFVLQARWWHLGGLVWTWS